jgi:hypothetical protein
MLKTFTMQPTVHALEAVQTQSHPLPLAKGNNGNNNNNNLKQNQAKARLALAAETYVSAANTSGAPQEWSNPFQMKSLKGTTMKCNNGNNNCNNCFLLQRWGSHWPSVTTATTTTTTTTMKGERKVVEKHTQHAHMWRFCDYNECCALCSA